MSSSKTDIVPLWASGLRLEMHGRVFNLSKRLMTSLAQIDVQEILSEPGPPELDVAGLTPEIVYANEAWPHIDQDYADHKLVTISLCPHPYYFGCLRCPEEIKVRPGDVFDVEPLELHWLRPEPLAYETWLGLQWVVPNELFDGFMHSFKEMLNKWSNPEFSFPMLSHRLDAE